MKSLFYAFLLYRVFNSFVLTTFFSPDEYWQSLEVAHKIVFGYGYLTWEWIHEIRSAIHPLLFALGYKVLDICGIDTPLAVRMMPKLLQAFMASFVDFYSAKLASELFGSETGKKMVLVTLLSWFQFYTSVRTFINSFEMFLVVLAAYYWPRNIRVSWKSFLISLLLASLSVVVRPTASFFWGYMGLSLLFKLYKISTSVALRALMLSLCVFGLVFVVATGFDSIFYGHFVISQFNFFRFNVSQSISLFYGGHPFHWYFTQGLPVILTSFLPLLIYGSGLFVSVKPSSSDYRLNIFGASLFSMGLQSFLAHKEFRFLQPFVPFMLMLCAHALVQLPYKSKFVVALIFIPQVIMSLYMSIYHQAGVVESIIWLSRLPHFQSGINVLLLMGCHSTPFYSHLHRRDIHLDMITCEPPLK